MKKTIWSAFIIFQSVNLYSQILGGGTTFSGAQVFSQSWTTSCPSSGTTLSNQAAFEPSTAMDGCGSSPSCNTGTTGSDVWFYFFATGTTASIVINPSSSFDAAIQAFSGSTCAGLTSIGCVDAAGNNGIETLNLSSLTTGNRYYFRVFGATNSAPNRTGTYTFCGSTGLGSSALPVILSKFNAENTGNSILVKWTVESEINHKSYVIERSGNGADFSPLQEIMAKGGVGLSTNYEYTDTKPGLGANIYRLKIISINGEVEYSKIISINNKGKKILSVFPNPAKNNLFIDAKESSSASIINGAGLKVKTIALKKGRNEINISNIPAGTYYLQSSNGNETQVFTILR